MQKTFFLSEAPKGEVKVVVHSKHGSICASSGEKELGDKRSIDLLRRSKGESGHVGCSSCELFSVTLNFH